ncbi:MAG: ExbD/TolR family protein [Thermaurantiacus sp.]
MGMSVGDKDDGGMMAEINTTPLVDVMLVLLIIFLITVPVAIQAVPVNLPQVTNIPTTTKPENVSLSVDTNCDVFWGQTRLESNDALRERGVSYLLAEVDRQKAVGAAIELPEVHIRGDGAAQWQCVGGPISAMQRAGYQKIGFISEPDRTVVTR